MDRPIGFPGYFACCPSKGFQPFSLFMSPQVLLSRNYLTFSLPSLHTFDAKPGLPGFVITPFPVKSNTSQQLHHGMGSLSCHRDRYPCVFPPSHAITLKPVHLHRPHLSDSLFEPFHRSWPGIRRQQEDYLSHLPTSRSYWILPPSNLLPVHPPEASLPNDHARF